LQLDLHWGLGPGADGVMPQVLGRVLLDLHWGLGPGRDSPKSRILSRNGPHRFKKLLNRLEGGQEAPRSIPPLSEAAEPTSLSRLRSVPPHAQPSSPGAQGGA
jgi:hypothetical protein